MKTTTTDLASQTTSIPVTVPGQVACVIQALLEESKEADRRAKDFDDDHDSDLAANESGFAYGCKHASDLLIAVYQKFPDQTLEGKQP